MMERRARLDPKVTQEPRVPPGRLADNDSVSVLYLSLGPEATTDSYTTQLEPGDLYEIPYSYLGIITGTWATADGQARITGLS